MATMPDDTPVIIGLTSSVLPVGAVSVSAAAPFDLEFTISLSGRARAAVMSQAITSLAFLMAQTPVPPESLRKWATSYNSAEESVTASRGGRPPPRSAPARKALEYLSRLEALDGGVRSASLVSIVHAAVLVFGPTPLAPRLVVHIAFADDEGSSATLPERGATLFATPPTLPSLPGYIDELPPAIGAAVARKVARTLITAGPELFGGSLPNMTPLPMHVFLLTSPLPYSNGSSNSLPEGWLPRPRFVLRVRMRTTIKRVNAKPRQPRYALANLRVTGSSLQTATKTAVTEIETEADPSWWQWSRAPKGFRFGLGLPPMPRARRNATAAKVSEPPQAPPIHPLIEKI